MSDHPPTMEEYYATLPRKRVAAGVLLRGSGNRVVVIVPSYKEHLEIPGGVSERDEPPWDAAERELKEELGIVRRRMPVLVVDYVPKAKDGAPEGLLWIFDGGCLTPEEEHELRGTDEEVKEVLLRGIDEATEGMRPWLGRRFHLAFEAAQAGSGPQFSEKGRPRSAEKD